MGYAFGGRPTTPFYRPSIFTRGSCNILAVHTVLWQTTTATGQKNTTMKNLTSRYILALCLLVASTAMRAAPGNEPEFIMPAAANVDMERAVKHQIDRFVIFPLSGDAKEMYGTVDVAYVVNTEGKVVVVYAGSLNDQLRAYVIGKLARIQVGANPSGLWNTSHVRFTFRPE